MNFVRKYPEVAPLIGCMAFATGLVTFFSIKELRHPEVLLFNSQRERVLAVKPDQNLKLHSYDSFKPSAPRSFVSTHKV